MPMNLPKLLVEDTRQKVGYHDNVSAFCSERGIRLIRGLLLCGDYAEVIAPDGVEDVDAWLAGLIPNIQAKSTGVCVDTKYGLAEVYGNLVQSHDRVAAEADRAVANGWKLVFLVEDEEIKSVDEVHTWVNPRYNIWQSRYDMIRLGHERGKYMGTKLPPPPVDSERLERMMKTFAEHHGCEWQFCRKSETGLRICEILMGGNTDGH